MIVGYLFELRMLLLRDRDFYDSLAGLDIKDTIILSFYISVSGDETQERFK